MSLVWTMRFAQYAVIRKSELCRATVLLYHCFANDHYGVVVVYRIGPLRGRAVLYDSAHTPAEGIQDVDSVLYAGLQCARQFAVTYHSRLRVTRKQNAWPANRLAYISTDMLQQNDNYNCGVYAVMKAMSLNSGTDTLAHEFINQTRVMIQYAILGDLYWNEE